VADLVSARNEFSCHCERPQGAWQSRIFWDCFVVSQWQKGKPIRNKKYV